MTPINIAPFPARTKEMGKEELYKLLALQSQQFRIEAFKMIHKRGNGHWGGSSSLAEILTCLYSITLKINPYQPEWKERDRLILSKGHGAPILYIILAELGFFPKEELSNFRTFNSILQGHPCMNKTPGVDMSTGALGHGAAIATGMALASRISGLNYTSWVILGDGDLNEGVTWEAFMAAAKFSPPRLVFLIDYNQVQLDGPSFSIMPMEPLNEKLKAFRIQTPDKIFDGHSIPEIMESFQWITENQEKPVAVIYKTIKGKGISFTENRHQWHGAPIDPVSYQKGMEELLQDLDVLTR